MPRLKVEGLRVEVVARGVEIVDGISFEVEPGEIVGVVGESGSGKTTVALALLAYARPGARIAKGSIQVSDVDLLRLSPEDVRQLQGRSVVYVPQDPSSALNPALRVGEQVEEILEVHYPQVGNTERHQRVAKILSEVNLPTDRSFLRAFPHQLSGGQQQRVCLAMAFVGEPDLVVLDEPTTGLDVVTQTRILDLLRRLCRTHNAAAVYVSHDLAVVAELVDRVVVMYAGEIVETGPCREVLSEPAHPYTAALLAVVPDIGVDELGSGLPGRVPAPGSRPIGCSFAERCSYSDDACRAGPIALSEVGRSRFSRCIHVDRLLADTERLSASFSRPQRQSDSPRRGLVVDDLRASYGDKEVLHGIVLEIDAGESVALVGESGSGKTTLARCIVGLITPKAGSIKLEGVALPSRARDRPRDTRRRIQYVFQNPYSSLNPRRTAGKTLAISHRALTGTRARGIDKLVGETLEAVGLDGSYGHRYPHELSGGERQRVAIARALILEPDLLICDEITSSLDVSVQALIVELLAQLRHRRELSLIFITHNLPLVSGVAERVVVLKDGSIVEQGSTTEIFDAPQAAYTRSLLASTPSLRRTLSSTEDPPGGQSPAGREGDPARSPTGR
jgi:peptide/nickel transport system ATP-binding protein